jgi:antitoxin (DNA-binding transcriptional repressor) of toxin-antitoxin stability system
MIKLPIEFAQDQLAALVDSLGEGEAVILTRNEQPVAKLVR